MSTKMVRISFCEGVRDEAALHAFVATIRSSLRVAPTAKPRMRPTMHNCACVVFAFGLSVSGSCPNVFIWQKITTEANKAAYLNICDWQQATIFQRLWLHLPLQNGLKSQLAHGPFTPISQQDSSSGWSLLFIAEPHPYNSVIYGLVIKGQLRIEIISENGISLKKRDI